MADEDIPLDALVFVDGGVVKQNPSSLGGTWAFVIVCGDEIRLMRSGLVTPLLVELPVVSNNLTELLAAVQALEFLPDGWRGTLYTDSHVTRCRLVNANPAFVGIPERLKARLWDCRSRFPELQATLLDGHPNKEQLANGIGKRGNPVSKFNVAADKECARLALNFLEERQKNASDTPLYTS